MGYNVTVTHRDSFDGMDEMRRLIVMQSLQCSSQCVLLLIHKTIYPLVSHASPSIAKPLLPIIT